MGKNTHGGKKHKKYKKEVEPTTKDLVVANEDDGQYYAIVKKHYGNGRVQINYIHPQQGLVDIIANIRGKFRKRKGKNFVSVDNIVLISLREFETDKCDIIYVYKPDETNNLKRKGEIPRNLMPGKSNFEEEEDLEFIDYQDESKIEPKKPVQKRNNVVQENYGIISSDEEDEE